MVWVEKDEKWQIKKIERAGYSLQQIRINKWVVLERKERVESTENLAYENWLKVQIGDQQTEDENCQLHKGPENTEG